VPGKLAGILTEMATERDQIRQVVLGIGVNVNQTEFPPELAGRATSLQLLSGRDHDREALLGQLLDALEPAYQQALADGGADSLVRWRQLAALPRPCRVTRPARDGEGDSSLSGSAVDVDAQGALLLRDQAGRIHRVLSGELLAL
jgi:BirA family biotin operon repressor/biotin-[acetyl-CoA-carboxylase] ligase